MPKISDKIKYPEQELVNKKDYVIGTDYYDRKKTKTFPIQNLAQVLADILIEDGGIEINVGKTSQLINDGEFGDSRFIEEDELQQIIDEILSNLDKYELTENKQNNLNPDGTGKKFPTVDAVIQAVYEIHLKLSNKADVDGANSVGNLKDSIDKRHSHPHQDVIDSITAQDIINWNNSIGQSHNPLSLGLNTVGLSLNAAAQILQLTPGYSIPTNVDITKWNNLSNSIGNYALRDASNLLNITNWRTVLDLYSKPQVDNLLSLKQDKLTAGTNITINPTTNVISATDTTYSQGSGISIVGGVITNTAQNVTQTLGLSGQLLSLSNGGGSVVLPFTDWSNITNKPSTFAPSSHTHTSNEVISLTGYALGTNNALSATDSLNTALGKLQAQVNSKTSNTGTVTSVTAGSGLAGGVITTSGIISLSAATLASLLLANSSLQPGDPISLLNNDVPYATESWVNSQGYLTSFTETDPTVPSHVKGITTTDIAYWNAKLNASALNGYATELWVQQQNYLTSFTETDPIFTASPAFGITNANINNWNSKFNFPSGGNAGQYLNGLGNLVSFPTIPTVGNGNISYNGIGAIVGGGTSSANQSINTSYNFDLSAATKLDIGLGVIANSWGDHSIVGYALASQLLNYVPTSRTITINGQSFDLSTNRSWFIPDTDTITRLRGNTSGTYQSGDLTLLAGNNVSVIQNGNDFTINSSYVNTTYTSSNGIQLIGNNFSPVYGTSAGTIAQGNDSRFHNPITIGTPNGLNLVNQVLSMALAGALSTGALSSTDWNNFNNKVSANNGNSTYVGTGNIIGGGTSSANQSTNTNYSFDLTAQTKTDIGLGVSAYNSLGNYQPLLSNGLHTLLNGNKVDVAFDVNTYVKDKSNNDRLLFGNTSSTDVVIKGAVANGDFRVEDNAGNLLFRMNGSNKVPYFPQLPAPQTGDNYLAVFDSGNGLWKQSTKISDLVTQSYLTTQLNFKANTVGNNLSNIPQWLTNLGVYSTTQVDGFLANKITGTSGLSPQNFNFAIGDDGTRNFIQSFSSQRLDINPLGNDVTINGYNVWTFGNFDPNTKANTSGYYSGLNVGLADNSKLWDGYSIDWSGSNNTPNGDFLRWNPIIGKFQPSNISDTQSILGITTALNLNLQQVVQNGNTSTNYLDIQNTIYGGGFIGSDTDFSLYNRATNATQRLRTGGLLVSDNYADASLIPANGIYSLGTIFTGLHGSSDQWYQGYLNSQTAINLTWNDVLANSKIATYIPVFNSSNAQKFVLRTQSTIGNNYFSLQNNAGVETHYLGLGSTTNDNFQFVANDDTAWSFFSNGNYILNINNNYIETYRDLYVSGGSTIYTTNHGTSADWYQAWLNSQTAINLNLQQVTNNGGYTDRPVFFDGNFHFTGGEMFFKERTQNLGIYFAPSSSGGLFFARHSNNSWTGDLGFIEYNGTFQWNGLISTVSHGTSADWFSRLRDLGGAYGLGFSGGNIDEPYIQSTGGVNAILATRNWVNSNFINNSALGNYLRLDGTSTMQSFIKFNNGWSSGGDNNVTSYYRFYNNGNSVVSFSPTGQIECSPAISNNEAVTLGQLLGYNYATNTALANYVPTSRTLTINGTTFDLSTDRTWNIPIPAQVNITQGAGISVTGTYPNLTITNTAPNVQADWNATSGLAQILNKPTIPTVGNGNITYSGTGAITGGGTSTANQSGNTNYSFDLTPQTKSDIQQGVYANSVIPSIVDGVDFYNIPNTAPTVITIKKKKTIINVNNAVIGFDVEVSDGLYDGYSLAINGGAEWSGILKGSFRMADGRTGNIVHDSDNVLFWWVASMGQWVQAI